MGTDILGKIVLDGRVLGVCYFPAMPLPDQFLDTDDGRYRITAVGWVVPSLGAGRGLAELSITVAPVTSRNDTDG